MTDSPTPTDYDFVVLGAGIVGSAIARELARYDLTLALVEARDDVGDGTSKANTAILHTGFDAKPGTLESRMVSRGYTLLSHTPNRPEFPSNTPGRSSSPGTTRSTTLCRVCGTRPPPTATPSAKSSTPTPCTGWCPISARVSSAV